MRKLTLTISAAALALGGATIAYADHHGGKRGGADADSDGIVTLAEAKAHGAKQFARMDANGDGVINANDREARRAERFTKIDTDGDGEVSQEEMQAAHEARHSMTRERRIQMQERRADRQEQMFARADTDGSGGLSNEEMRAMHEMHRGKMQEHRSGMHSREMQAGRRSGGRGMAMLRRADTDGDKTVTRAEFDAAVMARFNRADADGSGTITKEEHEAARATMKARMQQHRDKN